MIKNYIKNIDLKHKRVFLRADLNIPIENKKIIQDYRLQEILPTIKYIQENKGKVILATHIGRPKDNLPDENLSTKIIYNWFIEKGFDIKYEPDLLEAEFFSKQNFSQILLIENLRFFAGEQGQAQDRERLADLLKNLADVYINDAFALMHRQDCSITLLPEKFNTSNRAYGFLIEKEIKNLSKLKNNPEKPYTIVLGGNKIKDKIDLLKNFLNNPEKSRPNKIIIGGALSYTFLWFDTAHHELLKNFIIEPYYIDFCKDFLIQAKNKNIEIILPVDHILNTQEQGVDIGPETIKLFKEKIKDSKTIFVNGSMGIYTVPEYSNGTKEILTAIAENKNCFKVAGGGDCVAAVHMFNLQNKFDYISTGGGATLDFLSKY